MTEGKVVIACRSAGPVEVVSLSETLDAWPEQDVRATLKELLSRGLPPEAPNRQTEER